MTGAGLPFTKRNGMMVVKKFADCPQEMDFNSNADNLYHDHKMLRRIALCALPFCLLQSSRLPKRFKNSNALFFIRQHNGSK